MLFVDFQVVFYSQLSLSTCNRVAGLAEFLQNLFNLVTTRADP